MIDDCQFKDIVPKAAASVPMAEQVDAQYPVPPVKLIQVFEPNDWEALTEEWLTYRIKQAEYHKVRRYSGPGDLGLDVVAFSDSSGFDGPWDGFQCKHYDHPLRPGDIRAEVAKIIYHSYSKTPPFNGLCRTPRAHAFVCPHGVGIKVGRMLADQSLLKEHIRENWSDKCVQAIGKGVKAPLEGEFLDYFENFDFSIFTDVTPIELIDEHAHTVFHASRFGGGLPGRAASQMPPDQPTSEESIYLKQLLEAYSDHLNKSVTSCDDLSDNEELANHYQRQRVLFYSAESLRNFARDRTPPQTFSALQNDIFDGVIDTSEAEHADAFARVRATVTAAGSLDISGNALVKVTRVSDKQGICHQLANDERLKWKKTT